jgi:hypothetical protein
MCDERGNPTGKRNGRSRGATVAARYVTLYLGRCALVGRFAFVCLQNCFE